MIVVSCADRPGGQAVVLSWIARGLLFQCWPFLVAIQPTAVRTDLAKPHSRAMPTITVADQLHLSGLAVT